MADRAIELSPPALKEWAIATFGAADKAVLLAGVVVVTLALGAGVGVLARRTPAGGLAAGAALAGVALLAAFDPTRPTAWLLPGLAALAAGAFALVLPTDPGRAGGVRVPADPTDRTRARGSRREVLALGAAGGVGALGWAFGEGLRGRGGPAPLPQPLPTPTGRSTPVPAGLEAEVPGISRFVTPASEFYRVDTLLLAPNVDPNEWRLTIDGMVDAPFTITLPELLGLDVIERQVTLACVSNPVGGQYVGSARWLGVRTSQLLARAGVRPGADQVFSTSVDGFTVSTPLQALLDDRDALVAFGMNGGPLPVEHGYPVRLLTPGLYGFVGATKWLTRMEVGTYAAREAYWTKQGWAIDAPIKPSARIEVPRGGTRVAAGPVKVGGTAWVHGVGVAGVQVRVDRGRWEDATLGPDGGVQYWRQWLWTWDATPGAHELQARVVDADGVVQDERVVPPFPNGASGLHSVMVTVG